MLQLILILGLAALVAELLVLIEVGSELGAFPTIALVFLTAAIGIAMIRVQGVAVLQRAQERMALNESPAKEVLEGVCLLIAGLLLLVPGFISDTIGFLLLVPPFRELLWHRSKLGLRVVRSTRPGNRDERVIEGEFRRDDK